MHNWRRRTSSGSSNEVLLPHEEEDNTSVEGTSCGVTSFGEAGITSFGEASYQGASYQQDTFSDVVLTSGTVPDCPYNSRITSYNSNGYSRTGLSNRGLSDIDHLSADQRSATRSNHRSETSRSDDKADYPTQKRITKRSSNRANKSSRSSRTTNSNVRDSRREDSDVIPQANNRKDMNVLSENCCLRCCIMITPNICRRILSVFKRGSSNQPSDSDRSGLISRNVRSRDREELDGASCGSSPRSSATGSPRIQRRLEYPSVPKSKSQDFMSGHDDTSQYDEDEEEMANRTIWDDLLEERNELVDELDETKSALLKLQELLLNGENQQDGDISNTSLPVEGDTPQDEVVIAKSKLQQTEHLCRELRDELSRVRSECMELQGAKAGTLSRLTDKEKALTQLNREVLRLGFAQQSMETEKVELEKQLQDKDRVIAEYKKELLHRDRQIEDLVSSFHLQQQEKEKVSRSLRSQIFELHERLKLVGETEASLAARVASQDRKMSWIENRITQSQTTTHQVEPASSVTSSRPSSSRSAHSDGSSEMQVVRDTLQTLRSSLTGSEPQQTAIDRLEQSIANLMDKLMLADHPASQLSDSSSPGRGRLNYDSTADIRRSPITSIQGYPVQRLEADSSTGNKVAQSTKILYFTDRTVTPFMCTIGKRLGEVRLKDIKAIFDRQGLYRYHFKAMDPEFGTVKEEITHDDAIIPGWEGKIVAWIEEDDR